MSTPRTHRWAAVARVDPRLFWPVVTILLLLVFNLLFAPRILALRVEDGRVYGGLIDVLENAAPLVLLACGMALVIGTGGIDLSVGAVMAIAGTCVAGMVARHEFTPLAAFSVPESVILAIAVSIIVAAAAGLTNGVLIGGLGVQPLMATLVLMVAGRGVAQLLSASQVITFQNHTLEHLGAGAWLGLPVAMWVALGGVVASLVLIRFTALGFFAEAIGDNRTAAELSGVPVRAVTLMAYTWLGILSGVAGILVVSDIGAADPMRAGRDIELDAILAVVVGGTALTGGRFSILGAVAGALVIQTLTVTILAQGAAEDIARIFKGATVLALCLLQSERFRSMLLRFIPLPGAAKP